MQKSRIPNGVTVRNSECYLITNTAVTGVSSTEGGPDIHENCQKDIPTVNSIRTMWGAALLISAMLLAVPALAQGSSAAGAETATFPSKPLTLIIPWPPGGGADTLGRLVARRLGEELGQNVVVDNRTGASGSIGAGVGARAAPDGYTLLQVNTPIMAINPAMFPKLPYDPVRSFEPIGLINAQPMVVVVNDAVPVKSYRELIEYARKAPNGLNYGSSGNGTLAHLAGSAILKSDGVTMTHVPYKGAAPAAMAVISGEVEVGFLDVITALPHLRSGKIRPLAITSRERLAILADVPTLKEAGGSDSTAGSWSGLVVPAGTPPAIVEQLANVLKKVVASKDFGEQMRKAGGGPTPSTAAEFAAFLKTEAVIWSKAVKDSGARIE
ncbi:MAG: tripartite tricarboxylate transporter substrate binding protein [Ideonella sp.]